MTASVQLIAALGGGWDVSQLPTPAQVSEKPGTRDYKLRRKKVGQAGSVLLSFKSHRDNHRVTPVASVRGYSAVCRRNDFLRA